jgi:apolipoprotein N-acyltransferase
LRARLAPFALAAVAGVLHALAMAWPWGGQPLWWLQLAALAVLAVLLQRAAPALRAAALAWVFALAWLAATFWWLFISMHVYGGLPAVLAVLAVLALAGFLGLYYAAAGALFARLRQGTAWDALLFGALWLVAELLRGTLFTGFPWGGSGYAHADGPLAFLAPWIGVYGMTAVAAAIAFSLSLLVQPARRRSARYWGLVGAAGLLLVACNAVTGRAGATAASGDTLKVALLQGNIPQDEKFQGGTGIPLALDWYGRNLAQTQAALIVAPETAIPMLPQQLPAGYLEELRKRFTAPDRAALVGIPLGNFELGYTNSVIGLKPGQPKDYQYDKHHLVPFGEFVPPLFKWFTRMMNIPLGDFNRGDVGQASFAWQGQRLAPNICYEDLFGEELAARFADPATAPTIFVNVSNIAWFGDTVAIDQHLQISRLRALEFRRPMLRATNTGATVIIDKRGFVTHALPRHTRGVLVGEVAGGTAITPYAWWAARFGLWPLWGLAITVMLVAAWRLRSRTGGR